MPGRGSRRTEQPTPAPARRDALPRRGAMPPRRPRTQAWGQLRPDPWRNAVGAGAGGGCDPASAPRFPGLGGTGRIRSVRPRGRRRRLRGCREPRARRGSHGARGRPWSSARPVALPCARPGELRAGPTPHHHPWTNREMQQPICRSGVRAAARSRPDLRPFPLHQAMPRAEAVDAQRREGQTAQPACATAAKDRRRSRLG